MVGVQTIRKLCMPPKPDQKLLGFYADESLQKKIDGFAETLSGANFKSRGRYSRKKPSRGDVIRFAVAYVIENVPLSKFLHFAEEQRKKDYPERDADQPKQSALFKET
jgi:hypothetical protein